MQTNKQTNRGEASRRPCFETRVRDFLVATSTPTKRSLYTTHSASSSASKTWGRPYSWQSGDHSCPIKGYNMLFWFHKKLINSSDHCGNCRWVRMLITRFARFSTLGLEACPEPPSGSQAPPPVPTAKTATQAAIHRSHFCNFAPPIIHSHIFVLTIPLRSQRSSWANVACLGI